MIIFERIGDKIHVYDGEDQLGYIYCNKHYSFIQTGREIPAEYMKQIMQQVRSLNEHISDSSK